MAGASKIRARQKMKEERMKRQAAGPPEYYDPVGNDSGSAVALSSASEGDIRTSTGSSGGAGAIGTSEHSASMGDHARAAFASPSTSDGGSRTSISTKSSGGSGTPPTSPASSVAGSNGLTKGDGSDKIAPSGVDQQNLKPSSAGNDDENHHSSGTPRDHHHHGAELQPSSIPTSCVDRTKPQADTSTPALADPSSWDFVRREADTWVSPSAIQDEHRQNDRDWTGEKIHRRGTRRRKSKPRSAVKTRGPIIDDSTNHAHDESRQTKDTAAEASDAQNSLKVDAPAPKEVCTSSWDYTSPEADKWASMSELLHVIMFIWHADIGNYVLYNCEPPQPGLPLRNKPGAIDYDTPNHTMAQVYGGQYCTYMGQFPRVPRRTGKRNGIASDQAVWNFQHYQFRNLLPQEIWDKIVALQVTKPYPIAVDMLFRPHPKDDLNVHKAISGSLWAEYGKLESRLKPGEYDLGLVAYSGMTDLAGARAQFYENNVFRIEIDLFWAQPATYRYWPFTSAECRKQWGHLQEFDIEFELNHVRHIIISTKGVSGPSNWCDAIRVIKAFRHLESVVFDFRHDAKRETENVDAKDNPEQYPTYPAGWPFIEGLRHFGVNVDDTKISMMECNKSAWFDNYKDNVRAVLMPRPQATRMENSERIDEPHRPTGSLALQPRDLRWKPEYGRIPKSLKRFLRRKLRKLPRAYRLPEEANDKAAQKALRHYRELVEVLDTDRESTDGEPGSVWLEWR